MFYHSNRSQNEFPKRAPQTGRNIKFRKLKIDNICTLRAAIIKCQENINWHLWPRFVLWALFVTVVKPLWIADWCLQNIPNELC